MICGEEQRGVVERAQAWDSEGMGSNPQLHHLHGCVTQQATKPLCASPLSSVKWG